MSNIPEGTTWFGGPVDRCKVTLHISADKLDPDEVTILLGQVPTSARRTGDLIFNSKGKQLGICRRGTWSLQHKPELDSIPEELETAILLLLSQLTSDLSVWSSLGAKYKIALFCGLFLDAPNRGLELSADLLKCLGDRGIQLGLDIYSPDFDTAFESFRKGPTTADTPPRDSSHS